MCRTKLRKKYGLGLGEGVFVGMVEARRAGRAQRRSERATSFSSGTITIATDPTLLSRAIAATEIGSTAKLVLVRRDGKDKKQLSLDVPVERRPKKIDAYGRSWIRKNSDASLDDLNFCKFSYAALKGLARELRPGIRRQRASSPSVDIVDLVGSYVQLRRQGRNYVGICPGTTTAAPACR